MTNKKKTDYNFVYDKSMYDSTDWSDRKPGQPFFMQIQLAGGKLRGASLEKFDSVMKQASMADYLATNRAALERFVPLAT